MNPRTFDLYLASGNAHKVGEFQTLLNLHAAPGTPSIRIHSAKELGGMPEVQEDTGTFEGNARKKAFALLEKVPEGAWALADDSGVCVDALNGAPGVESAYFAGPQADSRANLLKLTEVMRGVPAGKRGAHFYCLLCLVARGSGPHFFSGRCDGELLTEPREGGGFGYDPLFAPKGYDRSYAQLGDAVKHQISHRALAWKALQQALSTPDFPRL